MRTGQDIKPVNNECPSIGEEGEEEIVEIELNSEEEVQVDLWNSEIKEAEGEST